MAEAALVDTFRAYEEDKARKQRSSSSGSNSGSSGRVGENIPAVGFGRTLVPLSPLFPGQRNIAGGAAGGAAGGGAPGYQGPLTGRF